jgi:tight adherence protein B
MPIAVGVFVVVLVVIYGAYWALVLRPETQGERAVVSRLGVGRERRSGKAAASLLKARESLSSLPALETALQRWSGATGPLRALVARSGLRTTIGTVMLASLFIALLTSAALVWLTGSSLFALTVGLAAACVPFLYVRRVANKRRDKFEEQFPEAIDLIARALRAGHALPTAMQMVGEELGDPVGAEFRTLFEQQNYGLALPDALRSFADRVQLLDARFFVTAVLTQRETGGNMSEVLDKLASVIRERFKVKRQVKVVSAHGRITGVVLGFLPPVVAGLIFIVSPEHIRLLVDDPLGMYMLITGAVLQVTGVLIIRRIVDVEY